MRSINLSKSTWKEVEAFLERGSLALVPVGSTEQHGPHLPLATDALIAEAVAERVTSKVNAISTPTLHLGFSPEHSGFPGTLSLTAETFLRVVKEVADSLRRQGFNRIIFINAHGGNTGLLSTAIQILRSESEGLFALAPVWNILQEELKLEAFDHGGELETSILLAINPALVQWSQLKNLPNQKPNPPSESSTPPKRGIKVGWRTEDYSREGFIGDPLAATREKGERYLEIIVDRIVGFIKT